MIFGAKDLDRVEELQHREMLLYNCIDYIAKLWSINERAESIEKFKKILGFTDEDIKKIIDGEETEI